MITKVSNARVQSQVLKIALAPLKEDISVVVDLYIKGMLVHKVLIDGGAKICIIIEHVMHKLGLHLSDLSNIKAKVANINALVQILIFLGFV